MAEIQELRGCITQGETLEEVFERIENARRAWIEVAYEDGMDIQLPQSEQEYSGRFVIRLPRSLHRNLAEQATHEEVSLNQYVATILSSGVSTQEVIKQLTDALEHAKEIIHELSKPTHTYRSVSGAWLFDEEMGRRPQFERTFIEAERIAA